MNLSILRQELTKIERAIKVADEGSYFDLLDMLHGQRTAMNMLASHLLPRSNADASFLHDLIDELSEFVDDEPASEAVRSEAIEGIRRMNDNLRTYQLES